MVSLYYNYQYPSGFVSDENWSYCYLLELLVIYTPNEMKMKKPY